MDGLRVFGAWLLALLITLWLIPPLRQLALRAGLVDWPGKRKPHAEPTPLSGGAAMLLAILFSTLTLAGAATGPAGGAGGAGPGLRTALGAPLAVGAVLMFAVGLLDDVLKSRRRNLPAWIKLILQFVPATWLVLNGIHINYVTNPFGLPNPYPLPDPIDIPLTLLWLVGMTNAVNFIDGLDGLAGGVVGIAAFTLTVVAMALDQWQAAVWVAAILGACIGFLRYNFPPAQVFMGDAGSSFLGFVLAGVALGGYFKTATLAGLVVPLFALSLPVLNGFIVVLRRMWQGRPIYEAERDHTFDLLRRRGFSTTETVLIFLLLAMMLSAAGMGVALLRS